MMNLRLHSFELQLRHTFRIAHGSRDVQATLIVELEEDGISGYGEATATRYYGKSIEGMTAVLEELRPMIEAHSVDDPPSFWKKMQPYLKDRTFVQCALDVAAHDLFARKAGKPLYELWGLQPKDMPLSDYTIGFGSIEEMLAKMKALPWPVYKIKLGTKRDIEIIQHLRKHTDAVFRVDANTAWTAEQTLEYAPILKELGVEFIEQPLKADDWEGMEKVFAESVLPIIADESCQKEEDVEKCRPFFHGINIKLMKCGGLTPARRMIAKARELGLEVMVGCMTESTMGISAIAHLLPLLDYVDMDGALLIKNDIADGVRIEYGKVFFANENGTGAQWTL